MKILGVIPARGGSKGIPGKNLVELHGKPLLAYACEAALDSKTLAGVIVSTDDPSIAEAARAAGITHVFDRHPSLATDDAMMIDVLKDVLRQCDEKKVSCDAIALLQPTSPLRTSEHIDEAVALFEKTDADTVVSVVRVPHQFSPGSLMRKEPDGRLSHFLSDQSDTLKRQEKPVLYARNGPAILIVKRGSVEAGSFYDGAVHAYEMKRTESVDIDDIDDLAYAECLLAQREAE